MCMQPPTPKLLLQTHSRTNLDEVFVVHKLLGQDAVVVIQGIDLPRKDRAKGQGVDPVAHVHDLGHLVATQQLHEKDATGI